MKSFPFFFKNFRWRALSESQKSITKNYKTFLDPSGTKCPKRNLIGPFWAEFRLKLLEVTKLWPLLYLELSSRVELLQAIDSILSVDSRSNTFAVLKFEIVSGRRQWRLTQIHGTLRAWSAVMRFFGFTVSMLSMRLLASGVTVSHSGLGYWKNTYWVSCSSNVESYIVSSGLDLSVQTVLILIPEWWVSDEKYVQDDSCNRRFRKVPRFRTNRKPRCRLASSTDPSSVLLATSTLGFPRIRATPRCRWPQWRVRSQRVSQQLPWPSMRGAGSLAARKRVLNWNCHDAKHEEWVGTSKQTFKSLWTMPLEWQ